MTRGKGSGRGGGGGANVFISKPKAGDLIRKGVKSGTYDITVLIGIAGQPPQFAIPVKILVNGDQTDLIDLQTARNVTLSGIKLDPDKDAEIKVQKAGQSASDTLIIKSEEIKKAKGQGTSPAHDADKTKPRFEVHVGRVRLEGTNPVTFITRDENGDPEAGIIFMDAGQETEVNGTVFEPGFVEIGTTNPQGQGFANVKVSETGSVLFCHKESGEQHQILLVKIRRDSKCSEKSSLA